MLLLAGSNERSAKQDYWLGGSTAIVAGLVNVCSVIAFFAFASNVTGHVAVLTEELVKGHWHQLRVVGVWLLAFLSGAFVAHMIVTGVAKRAARIARGVALTMEIAILSAVGYYGAIHYSETLTETEYLVGLLLFGMGLQNSLVATVSGGVVKTTHLTGLMTDLGMELSGFVQGKTRTDRSLAFKLKLHLIILGTYMGGGILGGLLFMEVGFMAFFAGSGLLTLILAYDLLGERVASYGRRGAAAFDGSWELGASGASASSSSDPDRAS
ncbi:MAG: DUF1275 domain-containing protein [Sandaracinaceae bacterium]|nr:DUF1275 domain-containing protein [Sandaracinaceae bacterium]